VAQSQPEQTVPAKAHYKQNKKNRAGGVAQGEGPKFNPQYCQNKLIN
jgi:hypothetical protein